MGSEVARQLLSLATGARCNAVAPGTHYGDCDATVEEVRCMLPKGHQETHAALVEWPPGGPGALGWPDGGSVNGKLLSREYMP